MEACVRASTRVIAQMDACMLEQADGWVGVWVGVWVGACVGG